MNRSEVINSCWSPSWLNIIYSTAGFLILFENVLMIVVIIRTPSLHNIANIFVTSLAVTDVIVGLFSATAGVAFAIVKQSDWMFGYIYLSITAIILGTTMSAHLHIAAIALDRYIYIGHPFFYFRRVNEKVVFRFLLVLWCLVAVYMLATVLAIRKQKFCLLRDVMDLDIMHAGSWITLCLLVLTLLAYFRIAGLSLRHRRSIASVNIAVLSSTNSDQAMSTRISTGDEKLAHMIKPVRFFLVMTGSFATMMIPVTTCNFLYGHVNLDKNLLNIVTLLPIFQSGFNFFINIFMNSDFRQAVAKTFSCRTAS